MNEYNKTYQRHGYWEQYYFGSRLFCKGNYINGERDGYWEWHEYNDGISNKEFYL